MLRAVSFSRVRLGASAWKLNFVGSRYYSTEAANAPLSDFPISAGTVGALSKKGIEKLFPIQSSTFKYCFDGFDVVGRAQTGTGKTLAFALPIIEKLLKEPVARPGKPTVLIILPTRELAKQVCDEFTSVSTGEITVHPFYGGTPFHEQYRALEQGLDVAVGTPGRLLDHIMNKGSIQLDDISVLILDEADRMLDMGFSKDIEAIIERMPASKQTLLFSATIPHWVQSMISKHMKPDNKVVDLIGDTANQTAKLIDHKFAMCDYINKGPTIAALADDYGKGGKIVVFVERKVDANALGTDENLKRKFGAVVLHGDITQDNRDRAMKAFKSGTSKLLIATDIAARGIDVNGIELVIMSEPPKNMDSYIHRSGRTGRAGKAGTCITIASPRVRSQTSLIEDIRREIKTNVCYFLLYIYLVSQKNLAVLLYVSGIIQI